MLLSGEMNTKSGPSFTLNIHNKPNSCLDGGKEIYTLFFRYISEVNILQKIFQQDVHNIKST